MMMMMMKNNNNNNTKTATIKNNKKKISIPTCTKLEDKNKRKREKDDSSVPLLEFGTTYYRIPKQNQSSTGFCQEKENIHGIIIKPTTTTTKALFVQVV